MEKTIFVDYTHSSMVKMVRYGLIDGFKEKGINVVFLLNLNNTEMAKSLEKKYGASVEIMPSMQSDLPKKERILSLMRNFVFSLAIHSETYDVKLTEMKKSKKKKEKLMHYAYSFGKAMRGMPGFDWAIAKLRKNLASFALWFTKGEDQYFSKIFETYGPSLLFTDSPYSYDMIKPMRVAKRMDVPVIGLIWSWDNIKSKGEFPARIDTPLVWNRIMASELHEYHGHTVEEKQIVGAIQFNYHKMLEDKIPSRKEFFSGMGLDPNKKLITYTTASPYLVIDQPKLVEHILDCIDPEQVQVIVRVYIKDDPKEYQYLKKYPNLVLDVSKGRGNYFLDSYQSEEDLVNLSSEMKYSDIVINVVSSTTIDAAVFDTPVINLAYPDFSDWRGIPIKKYYSFGHYINIIRSQGVQLAHNDEELQNLIEFYLADPRRDHTGRKRIVENQCYKVDGKAIERVRHAILSSL